MNLDAERDYSAVRSPVLDFLIQHEVFRIEIAERLGVAAEAEKRAYPKTATEKSAATRIRNRHIFWQGIFRGLKWRAGTAALGLTTGRGTMSSHNSMRLLESEKFVARDGSIPHPANGRDQVIWKWTGPKKAIQPNA